MKVRAILNPRAGLLALRARAALLAGPWPNLDVIETRAAGHARELAAQSAAAGCDLVIAAGGDGTANEVAWGLLGTETALALVPVGSGNGLARTLRIPLEPRKALAVLAGGVVRPIDVGRVDGKPFLNVAGAGFDATVGAAFHAHGLSGGRRGLLTYVRLGVTHSVGYEAPRFRLRAGDACFEGPALLAAFVNGRQYGGAAVIAPRARLDDGLLDLVVFEAASRLEMLLNAPRLFLGKIEGYRRYRSWRARSAVLESDRATLHHRDGEPGAPGSRFEVTLEPLALRVLVPMKTAADPEGPLLASAGL